MKEKQQTCAQRIANSVWLRGQIQQLIERCNVRIKDDQYLADKERDNIRRARHEAGVDCAQHYKRQLERILAGKTTAEDLADLIAGDAHNTKFGPCSHCDALHELRADGTITRHRRTLSTRQICRGSGKPPGQMPTERSLCP